MLKHLLFILTLLFSFYGKSQDELVINFNPIGGVYEKPTKVTLDAGSGANIYYTLDGSVPSSGSARYTKPFEVNDVVIIRAVAYKDGKRSTVQTNTYVCDRKYDLPVVSLATEPGNLWDFESGIYVEGCCADTVEPHLGANYWRDWERSANIEMYDEEGKLCFNQGVGINIFGGFSRMLPMKSIAVFARTKYGNNRIEYPIFPEREMDEYKNFILRNSGGDFQRTHLRDAFMTQMAKPTGVAIQAYRPAVLFINGKYWGIQNLREKINEHYLHDNYGVDKDNVDILRQNGVRRHGSSTNYKKLLAYLSSHDLSKDENVEKLKTFMDVNDFIRYNIAEVYSDNRDAGGNIRYWRERNDSAKWRWVYYDIDQGLGNNAPSGYKRNTLLKFTSINAEKWPDPAWSTFIIRSLLSNKKLEYQYINTFADHLNTVYHPDTAKRLFESMMATIDSEMPYHQKRWGSSYENWHHHCNIVKTFIANRPHYCRMHIMQKFGLEDTVEISLDHPGKELCDVKFSSLDLKRDYKGIYFKNVPIQIEVKLKHDYELVGWEDDKNAGAIRTIVPKGNMNLVPIIQPKPKSKFADSLVFYEIAFFQPEADTSGDWIELYNNSNSTIDLSGWTLTERSYKKGWKVPDGTSLEPNSFIVLSENLGRFKTLYPGDSLNVIGDFEFGFSSNGELIKLYDKEGFMVDSLNYTNLFPDLGDTLFSITIPHPDSSVNNLSWLKEKPTPSYHSKAYLDYLQEEADKKYWTKVLYIGGGSFFFILVAGILFYRYSRKKRG
ncbi:CotH kinase family protein [Paracrocinitomix mangrovi]|uniref:CotH kinase family protein n=1 Tax=Paracrocinitomix mangrovi TaxID=2862509 RepID=UPI001C8D731C|nr:CotH kinase family protein [Paracrocinitomix mangrovi]UKN00557.1 CotH kinase family protein [Paracrocinitomix mangrovi]